MTTHPTREALTRFIRGFSARPEQEETLRLIFTHLLDERCVPCLFAVREEMAEAEPELREGLRRAALSAQRPEEERSEEDDESLPLVLRQVDRRARVIQAERALAPELLAELELRAPEARRAAIRSGPRYQLLGLVQYLVEQSREAVFGDLVRALELAELAVAVADALDPRIYIDLTTADMRAVSRACLGNAWRAASDLHRAEGAFQESLLLLQEGNRVSPIRPDVWSLLGSLRIDQGRYAEAKTVLTDALRGFASIELEPELTKVRIKLATATAYAGDAGQAVVILQDAIDGLTDDVDGRLRLQLHHNQALWMIEAGQALEALARHEKARALYEEHGQSPALRMRRRWFEGRLYAALGDLDLAGTAFEEVRGQAIEREQSYELAMVSLELALVYLRRGQTHRVQDLAEEMALIFRSHDLHRHALGAMYLFRQAARTDSATVGMVEAMLSYLQRSRNNPFQRFEPPVRAG